MNDFLTDPLLQKRIQTISRGDEDTAQAITLRLAELAAADPTFADQKSGYHIKRAAWEARHAREKATIYDRYVACEPHAIDPTDGDEVSAFDEYIPSDSLTPEQACEQHETLDAIRAAIEALPDTQRRVATLLTTGFEPSEIADRLGMSRSSVSHAIARARASIALAL